MKRSPKIPQMQGRCLAGLLVEKANAAAEEALAKAEKRAKRSRAADGILPLLILPLLLGMLTHCAPGRPATTPTAARDRRAEHAAPHHGRYDWYQSDSAED